MKCVPSLCSVPVLDGRLLTCSSQVPQPSEPTDAPWAHDMHAMITEPPHHNHGGPANAGPRGPAQASVNAPSPTPLNRALSTTKHIGNVQIRVFFGAMEKPSLFPGIPVKQYTRLPDHRPPLRRDKPVRISLPDRSPRYIFPAVDRSFIFIPRALRPNQQGYGRGRGGSRFGSVGGYSRRTSVFGGSMYGSAYSPSVAMSRRSSLAREVNRDSIASPNGSVVHSRPVVRLPPSSHQGQAQQPFQNGSADAAAPISDLPFPQAYPLPQKPALRENRPNTIPMHQPRPQKQVSVAGIESPAALSFNPPQQHQQPFHHQVPLPVVNGHGSNPYALHDPNSMLALHSRNASYPSQTSTGTPLSQIPERAIHAQPFQPHTQQPSYTQVAPQGYYPQTYALVPAQGYYYPPQQPYNPSPAAPSFIPQQQQTSSYPPAPPHQAPAPAPAPASAPTPEQTQSMANLVAQEVNGMVYYYDATQIPAVATFPAPQTPYQPPQQTAYQAPYQAMNGMGMGGMLGLGGQVGGMGLGGMMTPSPDGFYYGHGQQQSLQGQGMVYYAQ